METVPDEILATIFEFAGEVCACQKRCDCIHSRIPIEPDGISSNYRSLRIRVAPALQVYSSQTGYARSRRDWLSIMSTCKRFKTVGMKVFDPSVLSNWAIMMESEKGNLTAVTRLMKDVRVDASANENYALTWAFLRGNTSIVKELLKDEGVIREIGYTLSFICARIPTVILEKRAWSYYEWRDMVWYMLCTRDGEVMKRQLLSGRVLWIACNFGLLIEAKQIMELHQKYLLADKGQKESPYMYSAFDNAVSCDQPEVVEWLLEQFNIPQWKLVGLYAVLWAENRCKKCLFHMLKYMARETKKDARRQARGLLIIMQKRGYPVEEWDTPEPSRKRFYDFLDSILSSRVITIKDDSTKGSALNSTPNHITKKRKTERSDNALQHITTKRKRTRK